MFQNHLRPNYTANWHCKSNCFCHNAFNHKTPCSLLRCMITQVIAETLGRLWARGDDFQEAASDPSNQRSQDVKRIWLCSAR